LEMGYLIEEDLCTVSTKETVQKHRAVPASSGRTCVVVDCELANCLGDLWAIAYLLSAPNVDLRYVLATGGDTRAKLRVISKFLAHCGRADIEVGDSAQIKFHGALRLRYDDCSQHERREMSLWNPPDSLVDLHTGRGGTNRRFRAVA